MKRKKTRMTVVLTAAAAVLIGLGLYRVVRVYQHYRSDMLSYESRHLSSVVSTGARGFEWMLGGYAAQLDMLLGRMEFERAEETYAETGDEAAMWSLLARPDVIRPDMAYALAVYDGNGRVLAAAGNGFPWNMGLDEALGENMSLRADREGAYWFVIDSVSQRGLRYEIAVRVSTLFSIQSESARVGRYGYFFLLDEGGNFAAYSSGGESAVESMTELLERFPGLEDVLRSNALSEAYVSQEGYAVLRYPWPDKVGARRRVSDETLLVTRRLAGAGGRLMMGAAESFKEFDSFLADTLWEVAGIILMEIAGTLILFILGAWMRVENRRSALELEAVRGRADLMEEINRQQQSLAHTERLQQLGVMTSGIVHEFNNLLTPIMGQSMLLLEQLADDESSPQFESALDIFEASENARDTLRRMSDMGKKDVDMGFSALEVGALLKRTMNLSALAKDPHIVQELTLPEAPIYISGNGQLLTQAFLNLCINAAQAMGSEGRLTVAAERELRSGHEYVRVEVSDTGPGIEEDRLGSIYDPFFSTKGERGTGLGLAICKKIIETHKGTIAAANRPEGGAVFTVRIPMTAQGGGQP